MWSVGSTFASGEAGRGWVKVSYPFLSIVEVWNVKFPICIVPHSWMNDKKVP